MPPKRSFTDDYTGGPNPSPTSSNFIPPKRRKTYTGGANDWRRPSASSTRDGWWAVTEAEWERMAPAMKMNWTHVGRIMETEEGEPAPEACEQCRDAGDPRGCWVYSREAMRRYGFKTHVCARCRATANVCSLNPFFRNSVGLRDNRPPPERPPPHDSPYHHPPPSESRHRFPSPGPPEHHRYRSVTPPSERHGRGWPQSPTAKRHSFDDRDRYPPPGSERHIFPSPGPHHHHHHQRRLSPTPPSPHHPPPHHHRSHLSQSDLQPLPATGGAPPPPHPNDPSAGGGIPPPHPHSAPLLSLDSLAARLEVLEQQMDALRKDNVYIHEENNILRWRLADLEAPLQAQAQAAASSAAAVAATLTTAGAEVGEQDDDAADRKPVMTTTNTTNATTQPQPQQRSSASSRAVETLVMEESMASSLREQEQHEHEQQEQQQRQQQQAETDRRRREAEEEEQRRRRAEEEERERERAEERARREQDERHRLQVVAELEALRDDSAELGRKVGELEKGHGVTQQILRNMYYALD